MTPEEAQFTGEANKMIENNLSSVKIIKNTKGTTWEVKCKHDNPFIALESAKAIDEELRKQYEKRE